MEFFPNIFYPSLIESTHEELTDMEGQLFCFIFFLLTPKCVEDLSLFSLFDFLISLCKLTSITTTPQKICWLGLLITLLLTNPEPVFSPCLPWLLCSSNTIGHFFLISTVLPFFTSLLTCSVASSQFLSFFLFPHPGLIWNCLFTFMFSPWDSHFMHSHPINNYHCPINCQYQHNFSYIASSLVLYLGINDSRIDLYMTINHLYKFLNF